PLGELSEGELNERDRPCVSRRRRAGSHGARDRWLRRRRPGRRRGAAVLQVRGQILESLLAEPSALLQRDELLAEGMHGEGDIALEPRHVRREALEERIQAAERIRDATHLARDLL